ncbi:MAG: twin-arginine translocase TatA/TatE family subunit [Bacteroidales bacterium]|nr:twin-arginine translocase TatA/TatE family subunit [Bacteroidales bacterium]
MQTLLFVSGGEIFIVLLFVLVFFGSDKIPELARSFGKGVREFKKAADDLKKEFANSELTKDVENLKKDLTGSLEEGIARPVQNMQQDFTETFQKHMVEPMDGAVSDLSQVDASSPGTPVPGYDTYDAGYDASYFPDIDATVDATVAAASAAEGGSEPAAAESSQSAPVADRSVVKENDPEVDFPSDDFYYKEQSLSGDVPASSPNVAEKAELSGDPAVSPETKA